MGPPMMSSLLDEKLIGCEVKIEFENASPLLWRKTLSSSSFQICQEVANAEISEGTSVLRKVDKQSVVW